MKLLTLFLLLACVIGAFASFRSIKSRFSHPYRPPNNSGVRNAPRNCNPKKIPKFRNFNTSSIEGASFTVLSTPIPDTVNFADVARQNGVSNVLSYERPDCTQERAWNIETELVFRNGLCVTAMNTFKFGQGRESSVASTVIVFSGNVITLTSYFLGVDTSTGTIARYQEVLENGVYQDGRSYVSILVTDPTQPVNLTGVSEGLVKFCGPEALEEGFFEAVTKEPDAPCTVTSTR